MGLWSPVVHNVWPVWRASQLVKHGGVMRHQNHANDPVAEAAARQEGVIARMQALELGMTTDAIDARLKSGRWQRLHPGVYATFTGRPDRGAVLWAALLACGRGAMLSHRTAAELWGLHDTAALRDRPHNAIGSGRSTSLGGSTGPGGSNGMRDAKALRDGTTLRESVALSGPEPDRPVHVTIPSGRRVDAPAGVVLHYSSRLATSRHPTRHPPCTRIEDTVVDLTQSAPFLDTAISTIVEAVRRRLTTHERLLAAFDARKKLRWRRELTAACAEAGDGVHSLLEFRFVTRVERPHGLPPTRRQARLRSGGVRVYVDARNADHGVRIELDGVAGHTGSGAFRDMRRDNAAAADGEVTVRFGWDDVSNRSCEAAALLARVYTSRGWRGRPVPCGPSCPVSPS